MGELEPGTLLLPHGEAPPDTSLYYLGWCGGPPGWARLFVKLWEATGEQVWLQSIAKAARGVEAFVLPQMAMLQPIGASGPWKNMGQCCGLAGAGTFLLQLATSNLPLPSDVKVGALAAARTIASAIASRAIS